MRHVVLALLCAACTSTVFGAGGGGPLLEEEGRGGDAGVTDKDSSAPSDAAASVEASLDAASDAGFFGDPFAYVAPGVVANTAAPEHQGTVEGKDCMTAGCHVGSSKPFVFGGTVYTAPQGGIVVPQAEIRILGPDSLEVGRAYTDVNGNFWLEKSGTSIPNGSRVGVRMANDERTQTGPLSQGQGGCSAMACHGSFPPGRVSVPLNAP